ncbi:MAG: hypothetical protein M1837_002881 [Sclerophora amabilis]|nr:MAG: hypothetical protein M1837_002881 [Sclerophora amabilis]
MYTGRRSWRKLLNSIATAGTPPTKSRHIHGARTDLAQGQAKPKNASKKKSTKPPKPATREDLSARLATALSYPRLHADRSRINILSPQLCDDIIARLAPSLKGHENCDIIEVNPGVGLWSSKIHEYLKPRTHILMEPDQKLYLPFLQPLLDKPDSHYRHVPYSGTEWASYQRIVDEGMLPEQKPLEHNDPLQDRPNNSLLFLANFANYPPKSMMGFSSITSQMFHQLMSAVRTHSLFQAYGLVRMMVWIMDREKPTILPRSISDRRKSTVEVESTCDKVIEVAGAEGSGSRIKREKQIDVESAINVSKSMQAENVGTPESRKSQLQIEAEAVLSSETKSVPSVASGSLSADRPWHSELKSLEKRWEEGTLARLVNDPTATVQNYESASYSKGSRETTAHTREYRRMVALQSLRRVSLRNASTFDQLIVLSSKISSLLRKLSERISSASPCTKSSTISSLQNQIIKLKAQHADLYSSLDTENRSRLFHYNDDRAAFRNSPRPLLLHDCRPYHPLLTHPNDFSNRHHPLCLLDLHPAPVSPALHSKPSRHAIYELLAKWLFAHRSQPFVKELESLAPGAVEALVPHVPALRDRLRQDDWDLAPDPGEDTADSSKTVSQFRVRMLTREMLEGLATAWEGWLFRPSTTDLYMKVDAKYDETSYRSGLYGDHEA